MKITQHNGSGLGVVHLDGDELGTAIDAYLVAHRITIIGPRTVCLTSDLKSELSRDVSVMIYVDPAGKIADNR